MKMTSQVRWGMGAIGAAAIVLILSHMPASATEQGKSDAAQLRQGLAACGRVSETAARLRCFDELERRSRQAPPAASGPAAGPGDVRAAKRVEKTPAHVAAQGRPSRGAASTGAAAAQGIGRANPRQITVQVARTATLPDGRLRIVASNGMIWDQTQGAPARSPKVGSEVTISRNFFGGHWCQLNKYIAVRCRRADRPKEAVNRTQQSNPMKDGSPSNQAMAGREPQFSPQSKVRSSVGAAAAPSASQGTPPARSNFGLQELAGNSEPSKIVIEVASARLLMNGKLRIVASDGSIWAQTQGPAVVDAPKPGSHVTITRNFMGGHWCQINKWTAVRCAMEKR